VYFTDVRVPADHLIGEVNRGWEYIRGALVLERAAIGSSGSLRAVLDSLIDHCRRTVIDGSRLADRPDVVRTLVELEMDLEGVRLLALETASLADAGEEPVAVATMSKIATTELRAKLADAAMRITGLYGQLDRSDPCAPAHGAFESTYRQAPIRRFGGGTNEVMRDIVAQRGFGLPRSR
jgi:alkylation response protein AidB-like acyl-CoA dehydrogenase